MNTDARTPGSQELLVTLMYPSVQMQRQVIQFDQSRDVRGPYLTGLGQVVVV